MKNDISDYLNLNTRLIELGVNNSCDFLIIPENIESANSQEDFIFTETAVDVRKIFKLNSVEIELLQSKDLKLKQRKAIDYFAPILFIGYSMLSENYPIIAKALELLSEHISDYFKGKFGDKNVKLEVIVETKPKSEYKRINYEGGIEGLKEVTEIIKTLKK